MLLPANEAASGQAALAQWWQEQQKEGVSEEEIERRWLATLLGGEDELKQAIARGQQEGQP